MKRITSIIASLLFALPLLANSNLTEVNDTDFLTISGANDTLVAHTDNSVTAQGGIYVNVDANTQFNVPYSGSC